MRAVSAQPRSEAQPFKSPDLVSVIIPVYKVEDYLQECVASVIAQTHRELEIILVDDGSPDQCPVLCDAWADRDPRIRVIHKPNGGLSDARNAGIGAASGSYLTFVDGDDLVAPRMVEHLLACLAGGAEIAVAQYVAFRSHPPPFANVGDVVVLHPDCAIRRTVCEEQYWSAWARMYHRSLFDSGLRFATGLLYEDLEFAPRVIAAASSVAFTDWALYGYRVRPGSIMTGENGHSPDLLRVLQSNIELSCARYGDHDDLALALRAAYVMHATKVLARTRTESARFEPYLRDYVAFVRQNGRPLLAHQGSARGYWLLGLLASRLPSLIKPYLRHKQSHASRTPRVPL